MSALPLFSQSNTEAKAAYLLAEESYGKADFRAALSYLQEASTSLGVSNAKILYLAILIQRELANTDRSYLAKLDSSITSFENAPDVQSFNEDKNLEVMKIKLQLKTEFVKHKEAEFNRINSEAALKTYGHPEWPFGSSLEDLRLKHPAHFKKNKDKPSPGIVNYTILTKPAIFIFLKNNRLHQYTQILFSFTDDDVTYSKGKAEFEKVLDRLRQQLSFIPDPQVTEAKELDYSTKTYSWESDVKKVVLNVAYTQGHSNCIVQVEDKSVN